MSLCLCVCVSSCLCVLAPWLGLPLLPSLPGLGNVKPLSSAGLQTQANNNGLLVNPPSSDWFHAYTCIEGANLDLLHGEQKLSAFTEAHVKARSNNYNKSSQT